MVSQERVHPTGGTLPQVRVLFPRRRHLDLRLTSITTMPFFEVGEVTDHARTILIPLIFPFDMNS